MRELAQAIDDLAMTGRLSEDSRENIDILLREPEPVSDEAVTATDDDSKSNTPAKSTATASKSGGSKS
jgi:hypothetical protein